MGQGKNIDIGRIIPVFSIILLGALGSGLWDVFLKDLLFYLGNLFVTLSSIVYSGYIDNLYKNIGNNPNSFLYFPPILLIILIIFYPLFAFINFNRIYFRRDINSGKISESNSVIFRIGLYLLNNKRKFYLIFFTPCIIVSIMYINLFITEVSKYSAISQIDRRLEIIRPLINEQRYYELRSEYRLIDNKNKLVSFLININHISDENNIVLPEIKLFGIDIHKTKNQSVSSVGS